MFRRQCTFQLYIRSISYLFTQCKFQFQVRFRCAAIVHNVSSCKLSCCKLLLWCKPIFRFNYSQWFPMWKMPNCTNSKCTSWANPVAGLPHTHFKHAGNVGCPWRRLPWHLHNGQYVELAEEFVTFRSPFCPFPFLQFHLYFLKFSIPCSHWKFGRISICSLYKYNTNILRSRGYSRVYSPLSLWRLCSMFP